MFTLEEFVIINRLIKKNEIKELQLLLHEAYKNDTKVGINFQAASVSLQQIDEHIENTATFVTEIDHNIVATVSVRLPWSDNPGPYPVPHLGWIATHSQFSKQGYATQLIDWVEREYIQKQLKSPLVSLGTAVEHPWLKKFYNSIGYQSVEEVQKTSDHLTVYMVKPLNKKFDHMQSEKLKKYLNRNSIKLSY